MKKNYHFALGVLCGVGAIVLIGFLILKAFGLPGYYDPERGSGRNKLDHLAQARAAINPPKPPEKGKGRRD